MSVIRIVDTTLRDGEQSAGIALGIDKKIEIAEILDAMGIYQIEVGIPAMGGQEKNSIMKIVELGLKSRISVWNRMNINDIKESMSCGQVIIHICVPASDIQINYKLNKDRNWVLQNMKKCIFTAKEHGYEVVIGLEDASRADMLFLQELAGTAEREGADRIRYADTVGILHRKKAFDDIALMKQSIHIDLEIHAHNDLGMAVSNSIAAAEAGAQYVDTTICGIGERAGNCSFVKFVSAARTCLNTFNEYNMGELIKMEQLIFEKMKLNYTHYN